MTRTHLKNLPLLQPILTARFASFLRQRNYGYASSGELTNHARQHGFHNREDF